MQLFLYLGAYTRTRRLIFRTRISWVPGPQSYYLSTSWRVIFKRPDVWARRVLYSFNRRLVANNYITHKRTPVTVISTIIIILYT